MAEMIKRASTYLYRHSGLVLLLLLGPPMLWMVGLYLAPLGTLMVNSFYHLNGYTGKIVHSVSLETYAQLLDPANREIVLRTVTMAIAVTITDALLAFPLGYYIARFASKRMKTFLYVAITLPLWSSYLVKVYAWRLILAKEGILTWFVDLLHMTPVLDWFLKIPVIGGPSLSLSEIGIFIAFTYVWLPYMILPIQTALERVPKSLVEASGDLGANASMTFRKVILPLSIPGLVAGSIFTFSLTLGDFIVPLSLGNSSFFIGQAVYSHQGTSGNIPLAAAFTMVPILIMVIYLLFAKRLGAFDAL
jgi:putative spermidine/putrescine transport system permease protein